MRIALDATYSIDSQPSGIAVYSNHILQGLATAYPEDHFLYCYRPKQFLRAARSRMPNVRRSLLVPGLPTFSSDIFHSLNQRIDKIPTPKTVATFHDLFVLTGEYSTKDFRERFAKQARQAARRADLIIAVSEFTANQVTDLLKVERERIRVIPHGVDPAPTSRHEDRQKMILFVGALQARKNVMRIVEAFETVGESWRLVLAGAPTGYKAGEILDRIAESPCRERIEVTGYLSKEKLEALFARASIFAFPSLDEGFGIPALEAMAWGIPVLTSNSSALRELGQDAVLLVDPFRVEEIAGAMHKLTEDQSLRRQLATAGRERARDFTWKTSVEKTYQVYSELK